MGPLVKAAGKKRGSPFSGSESPRSSRWPSSGWPETPSAQAVYGSIAGTVADSSGAAVPGATVTITSIERKTGGHRHANASGYYVKDRLLPGHYEVKAELTGFKARRSSRRWS